MIFGVHEKDNSLGLTDPSIRLSYEIGVLAYFLELMFFLEDRFIGWSGVSCCSWWPDEEELMVGLGGAIANHINRRVHAAIQR